MPLFYSKGFGGRHFGTNVTASRHGVHRGPWRLVSSFYLITFKRRWFLYWPLPFFRPSADSTASARGTLISRWPDTAVISISENKPNLGFFFLHHDGTRKYKGVMGWIRERSNNGFFMETRSYNTTTWWISAFSGIKWLKAKVIV